MMTLSDKEVECIKYIRDTYRDIPGRYTMFTVGHQHGIKLLSAFVSKCVKLGVGKYEDT